MVPERWALVGKSRREGLPCVHIAREKYDPTPRLTIWVLVRRNTSWYSIGQWISIGKYREFKRPVRLSDSLTDRKLLEYAQSA